jgi:hypothetical protein
MPWRSGLIVVTVWLLSAGCTRAADSVTIAIYTTVLPVCRFSASSPSFDTSIGSGRASDIERAGSGPASAAITYQCTTGVAPAFTLTAACAACPDAPSAAPLVLSDTAGVGRGMGSGRELTVIVTGPVARPLQTASASVAPGAVHVTVSP